MVSTPLLSAHDGESYFNITTYRQVVGTLQHFCLTRLEIHYSVNKVSQPMQRPLDKHLKVVKRIPRYLKVKALLTKMDISLPRIPIIWCDNTSSVAHVTNPVGRMKHVELDLRFVREKVMNGVVEVNYIIL
ncbi:putative N-acetyl-gamma-glutamyl-phosphate reductase, chloroplastic [Gossypium australe]|uniref:Putative N-acetyl-gamma-glutamyl-phosphate reductase, chloroplastic n=1 Tax=Gossypium australe TaxID=47621 RepID=A0A5B6WLH5_9ROSI|nr:putative N-acetyl-gamma-glutamyl-phosphate reductase, chloroplastic [Gossypium australe]